MRSELDVLLDKIDDPTLRADIRSQVRRIQAKRTFGLVFESHLPERVRLPQHPVRVGARVTRRDEPDSPAFEVVAIKGEYVTLRRVRNPDGSFLPAADSDGVATETSQLDALVVVADFGEPVFPGLGHLSSIERGGEKPAHVVIKGENHHALEVLQFTHAGKVDCIYIDPPYNTGASDWKYDNNYVDDTDAYRHSKWLAFMERRLLLARQLLNPEDSVLVVTIDEKEYMRLGLLLEQLFVGCKVQMVSIVINAPGQARKQELARVGEYAFFVFVGDAEPASVPDDLLNERPSGNPDTVRWESLLRSGTNSRRADRPALFYPVFVNPVGKRIVGVGDSINLGSDRSDWKVPEGAVALWPLKSDGSEGNWRASPEYLRRLLRDGLVRLGKYLPEAGRGAVWYLGKSAIRKIDKGEIEISERDEQGAVVVRPVAGAAGRRTVAKTIWNRPSHHAGWHGSALVRSFLPARSFPFPKALYAVEDALRICVQDKRDAVVLDFFSGSGTTTHAVARLNRQDGGHRQSIVVTNNEVSPDEARALRKKGNRPGDPEWEALGIFDHITRPRITAAITGRTPQGEPVEGDYKFADEFPMAEGFAENVKFFELDYLDAEDVELDLAFSGIASLLWLRAGGHGPIIESSVDAAGRRKPYAWTNYYGVLFNPDRWRTFVEKLPETASTVFIVTDSQAIFAGIASELPGVLDVVRLYENYLATFATNQGQI